MFSDAIREVRHHPGRIVATLIAIAISVGFMAAVSVFLETEKGGLAKQLNRQYAGADVLVQRQTQDRTDAQVIELIKSKPGVAAAEASWTTFGPVEKGDTTLYLQLYGTPSETFRWSKVVEGAWPQGTDEIALPRDLAKKLDVAVGGEVSLGEQKMKVSGLTDDPPSRLIQNGYISPELITMMSSGEDGKAPANTYLIKVADGTTPDAVVSSLSELTSKDANTGESAFRVETTEAAMQDQLKELTMGVDALKYALMVFAGIALLVGMIIIANTFTILIAQRRRQIGLLRAVGASTSQVRKRFIGEAIVLGLLGSLLGVALGYAIAALGSWVTGSLHWGLAFPWRDLLVEIGVGVLITLLAALVPIWRTSRVAPLEALRPVLSADSQKRVSKVRAIICTVLLVLGIGLSVLALTSEKNSVLMALGSAFLITFAVLGAAPLYVALLIKGWGKLVGLTGPTSRLATMNAARNPQRAAATAVALMLAIGLIITLQVGAATVRETALSQIEEDMPVDVVVGLYAMGGPDEESVALPKEVIAKIDSLPNVRAKALLQGGATNDGRVIVALNPQVKDVAPMAPDSIPDDVALVSANMAEIQSTETLPGVNGEMITLKLQASPAAGDGMVVNDATLRRLVKDPQPAQYWFDLVDRENFANTQRQLSQLSAEYPNLMIGGGAFEAYLITQILNIMLAITSALLGVAVAIALVGVANTLGLSVIERTRESALLRALGMPRVKLRLMLLIEAITLALVGVVVGVIAGAYFAWLGISAVFKEADIDRGINFAIDWQRTLVLVGIAVVAAAIASILPGRRAAMATPTEALAID
ncbi:ABC transporter permease [Aestuariimicrobium ganziense]|uniref:ABC transporter permease n=1 Tax=Aestuariimicrobium ganziense TaxID=2773677 RepID=UPI0019452EA6|nr:ABC transporter permease [Aestuariimicrobium ganziense]